MIQLNGERGEAVYVSPENIAYMKLTTQGQTGIKIADGYVIVTDSMEEVAHKVLEYKTAMCEYRALSEKLEGSDCDKRLYRLAGLITG